MAMEEGTAAQDRSPGVVPRWLRMLALLAAMLVTAQSIAVCYMGTGWSAPRGVTGINALTACDAKRFCAVSTVTPAAPAARAGIMAGDRVRLDRYWERRRTHFAGDLVGMTVRHDGADRHVELVTASRSFYAPTWIIDGLASAVVCIVALLILARAGRRWWSLLLGLSLVSMGIPGGYPRFWQNDPALFPWFFVILAIAYMAGPVLLLAALRGFRRDMVGTSPRWLDRLVWIVATAVSIATIWGTAVELDSRPILGLGNGLLLTSLTWSAGSLLGPIALAAGWHNVPPEARTRYAFMWAAVGVSSIHPLVDPLIIAAGNNYADATGPVVVQLGSMILGAALFAYAILRHRVVDLGFAINRTLVFSILSFVTLLAFGLVEWASEKLLPFESHEASAIIQAGVALALFLTFHHLHGWVEHAVERLFFHRWHANETAVRRFLHQASYITAPDVLIERMIGELERFSGGAAVVIYRAAAGAFVAAGKGRAGIPALDIDAPMVVALRADRGVVRDDVPSGAIALPMMHRAELTGVVVLGAKVGGDPYRPDEEAILAELVARVGLDLYALRVEALEAENARLTERIAAMAVQAGSRG